MARIEFESDEFNEAVATAVKDLLQRDTRKLEDMTEEVAQRIKGAQRAAISELEESTARFKVDGRAALSEADGEIAKFRASMKEKKNEVENALNVKVLGAFTVVVLLLTLSALGYLGERLTTVRDEAKNVLKAAGDLGSDAGDLKLQIDNATTIYKSAFASAAPDVGSSVKALVASNQNLINEMNRLTVELQPLFADYARQHPAPTGGKAGKKGSSTEPSTNSPTAPR